MPCSDCQSCARLPSVAVLRQEVRRWTQTPRVFSEGQNFLGNLQKQFCRVCFALHYLLLTRIETTIYRGYNYTSWKYKLFKDYQNNCLGKWPSWFYLFLAYLTTLPVSSRHIISCEVWWSFAMDIQVTVSFAFFSSRYQRFGEPSVSVFVLHPCLPNFTASHSGCSNIYRVDGD
jgi:hypothetical protein